MEGEGGKMKENGGGGRGGRNLKLLGEVFEKYLILNGFDWLVEYVVHA